MSAGVRLEHDWSGAEVPDVVVLGERSWLWSAFAFLHFHGRRLAIGADTGVYHGSMFELGPDGDVEIGARCVINGAIFAVNSRVVIGDHALVAFGVVLADRFAPVPHVPDTPAAAPAGAEPSILVGDNAWIGTRATLLAGARIGEGAIVGAACVVDGEVPPFAIVAGNPWRVVGRASIRGTGP